VINDASDKALVGLRVFGKSTQDGTPTPDAPVEIVSVENPTVKVDTQSLSVPYTLHGIPVTSGGNYIDDNGQQWICDEVDFARGVVTQRVKHGIVSITNFVTLSNGVPVGISKADDKIAKFKVGAYCEGAEYVGVSGLVTSENQFYENQSSFGFSGINDDTIDTLKQKYDGLRLIYVLATPIEKPLTADQIEAYKALHTNEPNTTILNDQDAWMEVKYISK
jgi:hypothetical protein